MPLTKVQKEQMVAHYQEGMAQAPHAFLVDYAGIDVPQATELRSKIRETGGKYEVVRNRLALHAIKGQPLEALSDSFQGPIAIAYSDADVVALAKALTEFAKTVPALEFRGGLVDGQAVKAEEISQIAELPSREELIAKMLFLLQSPLTGLVRAMGAITRDFVVVVDQVRQQKEAG